MLWCLAIAALLCEQVWTQGLPLLFAHSWGMNYTSPFPSPFSFSFPAAWVSSCVSAWTHAQHEQCGSAALSTPAEAESSFHTSELHPNWTQVQVLAWTCQGTNPCNWLSLETYGIVQSAIPSHTIVSAPWINTFGLTPWHDPRKSQWQWRVLPSVLHLLGQNNWTALQAGT